MYEHVEEIVPAGTRVVTRVLVADDDDNVRQSLADLLAAEPGFEVAGVAADADEAIAVAAREQPDVAILDWRMPGGGGVRAAWDIRNVSPRTRVIALSAYSDRDAVFQMLRAGAAGYLVKGTAPGQIVETVLQAIAGQNVLSPAVAGHLVTQVVDQLDREALSSSKRNTKVERIQQILAGDGLSMVFQPIVELESG